MGLGSEIDAKICLREPSERDTERERESFSVDLILLFHCGGRRVGVAVANEKG